MPLEVFGFLHISITDIIDLMTVAAVCFIVFKWIKGSSAGYIILAIVFIFLLKFVTESLSMRLTASIINAFIDLGLLAIIILFQPEIRHFLMRIGKAERFRNSSIMRRLFGMKSDSMASESIKEITEACKSMSETKTGALIVFPHKTSLQQIIETGDTIDGLINRRLIMNLFFKNSPLHDGAMIISGNRIVASRCTLPITARTDIPASFGMRHKAAIGVTEETDADVIVVSEETGGISFVRAGKVTHINDIYELKLLLQSAFESKDTEEQKVQEDNVQEN